LIDAIELAPLLHVPPDGRLLSTVVKPWHIVGVPVMAVVGGFTVITALPVSEALHTPVTIPKRL